VGRGGGHFNKKPFVGGVWIVLSILQITGPWTIRVGAEFAPLCMFGERGLDPSCFIVGSHNSDLLLIHLVNAG